MADLVGKQISPQMKVDHWHGDCPNGGRCPECYLNDGHRVACGYNPFAGRPCVCDRLNVGHR